MSVWASLGHAQTYRATNLGTIPSQGGTGVYATAINNSGQIVGYGLPIETSLRPFLWQNGTLSDLGTLGGSSGQAYGINNTGQIVGSSETTAGTPTATLWANGMITNLGSPGGVLGSSASGINSSEQVVGTSNVGSNSCSNPADSAFIWISGVISSLDTSASVNSVATAINDSGEAVGYVQSSLVSACASQAALFAGGTTTILPQLPGGDSSTLTVANAINEAGQIVGYTSTPDAADSTPTAVLWSTGSVTAVGSGEALGINNTGQIVGLIPVTNGDDAALWTAVGAKALDLNTLIDPATPIAPLILIRANAINDSGWIIAIGSADGGVTAQSFLLEPEPVSVELMPASLVFASQTVGTTSEAQAVTVKNSGATAFNLNPLQVSGDYSQTNNCGASVTAGSSCAIQVKFAPTAPGTRTGVLTVASGGTSSTVNLTGTATIAEPSSGGGGGALDALSLLTLLAVIELRRRTGERSHWRTRFSRSLPG